MTTALAWLLAWSAGVAITTVTLPGSPVVGVGAAIGAALATAAGFAVRRALVAGIVAAALLGAARSEIPAGDPSAAARAPALVGLQALAQGRIADDPRLLAGAEELLVAPIWLATASGPRQPAGSIVAFVKGAPDVGIDDVVQVTGRLDLPRDLPTFNRRAYAAQKGAYLEIRNAALNVVSHAGGLRALPGWLRDRYRGAITSLVPPPHAGVLVGVVLGVRTGIPAGLQQDLIATGLVHLLVLSGLKVAVFARLVSAALAPLLGRSATFPAVALIVLYALAGGGTPAALRAAAMGGLALVAARLGRPTHLWTSLAATGAAMLAWRPDLAWDVGFQLSFFGTAAIVFLTPGIEARLTWMPGWLREPLAVTLAAQVGTVPLMATDFHVLSPVAPIANAAVLPLLPVMVGAGLLVAPLAAVPEIGRIAALPLTGMLVYLEQVASLLARAPSAAIPVPAFDTGTSVAYYTVLGAAVSAVRTHGWLRRAAVAVGVLVPLAVGGAELAAWARPAPAATVLDIGQGQAVLLSGPGGYVLVDGGASPSKLADELGAHLPPWQRGLAGIVITGPGIGHVGGLAQLAYSARMVLVPEGNPVGSAWRAVALAEAARGARIATVHAGQSWWLAGLHLDVLSPEPDAPEPGQVALRVVGPEGHSFCDLADLDPDGQTAAAARLTGTCEAVLVPNGGRSAPAPDLLAAARPSRLIVSDAGGLVARDLPHAVLARTSQEGAIVLPL